MDANFRSAQRSLGQWVAQARATDAGPVLEISATPRQSPRLIAPDVIEAGPTLAARAVPGGPAVGFAAFLDGTQRSRLLMYYGGVPVVHGTVGAVIRARRDRRMITHPTLGGPVIERAVYAPRALLPDEFWGVGEIQMIDTGQVEDGQGGVHPTAILERAIDVVQEHRERVERVLAERWCESESAPLWIDGGLAKSERVAAASQAVGVVKSHRTMYVGPGGLDVVCGLGVGERTTVFRVTSKQRTPVRSWYLRMRDATGRAPFWGLVRVEVADDGEDPGPRADLVSRWVLAEVAPLALPDARWDTLVYGVRDCEEFLRAVC